MQWFEKLMNHEKAIALTHEQKKDENLKYDKLNNF